MCMWYGYKVCNPTKANIGVQVSDTIEEIATPALDSADVARANLARDYRQQPSADEAHASFPEHDLASDDEDSLAVWHGTAQHIAA